MSISTQTLGFHDSVHAGVQVHVSDFLNRKVLPGCEALCDLLAKAVAGLR